MYVDFYEETREKERELGKSHASRLVRIVGKPPAPARFETRQERTRRRKGDGFQTGATEDREVEEEEEEEKRKKRREVE